MISILYSLMALLARPLLLPAQPIHAGKVVLRMGAPTPGSISRYGEFSFSFAAAIGDRNPFDPDQVDIEARFTSPQGKTVVVPAFINQEFTRRLEGNREATSPAGTPSWWVRFTPDTIGVWRYRVVARIGGQTSQLPSGSFRVVAGNAPGFVRRNRRYPALFAYDSGRAYFPIGENMCWAGDRGTYDFDLWLADLHKAGGDWIRLWMWENRLAIEWGKKSTLSSDPRERYLGYHGVGVYSLDQAWKVDRILDTAERNGVKVMVCFGTYGEFNTGGFFNEGSWPRNPYNIANGGPCARPEDFWTDPAARKLYRNRLRYLMARYGWRTNIFGWEFWNEANAPTAWIAEMARYIKGTGEFAGHPADPYGHLLSTTYGNDAIWRLPEFDFTMTHHYGTGNVPDEAPVIHSDAAQHANYGKPHLMAEFGIDWRKSDSDYDPDGRGVNLHNGLWSALASGDGGTGMLWYWDNYVAPKNVYGVFPGIRRFVDALLPQLQGAYWQPLHCDAPKSMTGPPKFVDLRLVTTGAWGKADSPVYTVSPMGTVKEGQAPAFLYSPGKPELRTTPAFHVRYSRPGRFILHVNEVSGSAHLTITLDGQQTRELDFNAAPPADNSTKPEYASTVYEKEYGIYKATYNRDYDIDVPAGEHTITLNVTGGDWMSLSSITLTNYRDSRFADMNTYAMTDGRMAILWAQNPLHNWQNVLDKKAIPTLHGLTMHVTGLPAGRYTVAWWDTTTGAVTRRDEVTATADGALLRLPDITADAAAQIIPISVRAQR